MAELKKGDVVALKSGGPRMTVEGFVKPFGQTGQLAQCTWFDGEGRRHQELFAVEALEQAGAPAQNQ